MVKLKSVEFAGAIGRPRQEPPGTLPQVAFAGRSNVGKSSLINRLLERHRRQIARVSATPGKTQEINFYRIRAELERVGGAAAEGAAVAAAGAAEGAVVAAAGVGPAATQEAEFFLVDLPGYGYARAPGRLREAWRPLIESYLRETDELLGVVQLIDSRHDPTPDDLRMLEYLSERELPTLIVLTKVDKLKSAQRERRLKETVSLLGVDADQIVPFSSETGEGRADLLSSLSELIAEGADGGT